MENYYPSPKDLSPRQVVETAEDLFNKKDYGASLFYANLALKIGYFCVVNVLPKTSDPDQKISLNVFIYRANDVLNEARTAIQKEVETNSLAQVYGWTLNDFDLGSLSDFLQKNSKHTQNLRRLKEQYGLEYKLKIPTREITL